MSASKATKRGERRKSRGKRKSQLSTNLKETKNIMKTKKLMYMHRETTQCTFNYVVIVSEMKE